MNSYQLPARAADAFLAMRAFSLEKEPFSSGGERNFYFSTPALTARLEELCSVTLTEFLSDIRRYLSDGDSWQGWQKSLLARRDSHVLVSAQACFLPIPAGGEATFWEADGQLKVSFRFKSFNRSHRFTERDSVLVMGSALVNWGSVEV